MAIENYTEKNKIINSMAAATTTPAEAKKCPYLILANIHAAFHAASTLHIYIFAVVYKVFKRK